MIANLAVLAAGELATRGLTFLAFVHIARVLEPASFGMVETALAVMMFATLGVEQGFGILGAREIARDRAAACGLADRVVSTQMLFALAVFALLAASAAALPMPRPLAVLLVGFGLSLFGVPFLLPWVFQGRGEMVWYAAPAVLRQAVFLAAVWLVVAAPRDLGRLPVAEILAVASAGLCYAVVYRRRLGRLRARPRNVDMRLLRESAPIGGSQLIWALRMYLPVVVVSALLGSEATGYFGPGHRIVMVFQALVGVYFTNLLPDMALTAQRAPAELSPLLRRSVHLVAWPTLALATAASFGAAPLLGWVFGGQYVVEESVRSLAVLMWTIPVLGWRRNGRTALIALDQQRVEFRCALVGIALLLVLLPIGVRAFGIAGAGGAMLLSELAATALTWLALRSALGRGAPPVSP